MSLNNALLGWALLSVRQLTSAFASDIIALR
jgi:hypothetical protein